MEAAPSKENITRGVCVYHILQCALSPRTNVTMVEEILAIVEIVLCRLHSGRKRRWKMLEENIRIRIKLEALITEREGMLVANYERSRQDYAPAYCEESFMNLTNQMLGLLRE